MKLTVDQALQQGVAAHKVGKLQEAERLYRAILQTQPTHPDANHNLGILAVSVNKSGAALPLFKIALEVNPKKEQFWVSYIDALIKESQFINAKKVLEEGKKRGLSGEKVDALEVQLTPATQKNNSKLPEQNNILILSKKRKNISAKKKNNKNKRKKYNPSSPSQAELNSLFEHYQNGRYDDAEKLAIFITEQFPEHQLSWKVLGVVLRQTGRMYEALIVSQKAVELDAQDSGAHYNLGITLQGLDRLEESEASYRQAIALNPDFAEAHYSLGLLLFQDKQYKKAAEQFRLSALEKSKTYLLTCLYYQDEQSLFFDQLDYFINQGEIQPMIGSLGCRSALRYGVERPNLFCKDPLKYVFKTDLNNQYDFEKVFVKTARTILNENRIPYRKQDLLANGRQTSGNVFRLERYCTEEIQNNIRSEIEKYKIKFKDSEEGFITSWPTDYSLYGWLVSMKSGGEIRAHMHEKGWISGSIYINVPPKPKTDSGNLVVCIEEEHLAGEYENQRKNIDVITGSLCLFPASLLHYTIPFESEEERIVLAFDVLPKY
jgi:tetratricopeptide (TPR) repeat protein